MKRARNGPTLTQVPVVSLKSSAMRPSNSKPSSGRCGVHEFQGIAEPKKAFLVERRARQLCLPPVARRNVGPAHPGFQLAVLGQEFELNPGRRDADVAGPVEIACGGKREGRGFRRSKARQKDHALATRLLRQLLQCIPGRPAETGASVEQHFQAAEEGLAQLPIRPQVRKQRIVALGHVEIDGRRDLAQVAHGLCQACRRGVAIVDVERAAIAEHHVEVVVAAEGVAPGKPIDHHRRLVFQKAKPGRHHCLVRTQHSLRVDDGLGRSGRT